MVSAVGKKRKPLKSNHLREDIKKMDIKWNSRWRRGWLPRCGALQLLCCFCWFVLRLVILFLSVSQKTNYWTLGNTHQTTFIQILITQTFYWTFLSEGQRCCSNEQSDANAGSTGALVKLHERGLRTTLPSIHLANLRSLPNKMDELLLLTRTNKDFLNSAALCFTETWLREAIPDNALHLPGFQLFRADRVASRN